MNYTYKYNPNYNNMSSNYGGVSTNYNGVIPNNVYSSVSSNNDERLAGGFIFPFLLGGVTGAAVAPAFWGPGYGYNRPNYYQPYQYRPYPYYNRRWF